MARNDYGPLREAHQAALDASDSRQPHSGQEVAADPIEPTRPEGHYGQSPGWTPEGGMEQQQAAATRWAKASQDYQEQNHARRQSRDDREQEVEPGKGDDAPQQERKLVFSEDRERAAAGERSDDQADREETGGPSKEEGEGRTLRFFEDRHPGQDHDRGR